jgi:hypothetical protein
VPKSELLSGQGRHDQVRGVVQRRSTFPELAITREASADPYARRRRMPGARVVDTACAVAVYCPA